jgi:hypothetical protein
MAVAAGRSTESLELIEMVALDPNRPMGRISTGELLCIPFLDTNTTKDTALANIELDIRGYPMWLVAILRKFCAVGLWTQLFLWEDFHLDLADVAVGYGVLFAFVGVVIAFFANFYHPRVALFGLCLVGGGAVLIAAGVVGWRQTRKSYAKLFAAARKNDEL